MPSPPIDLALLPSTPGVYRYRDAQGRVLYVGRAVDLRRRVRSYWGSQRGRPRMRRMVPQIVAVEAIACASEHEAAWLERNLLVQSRPRFNRARGGLENPVYLRLDPSPARPSLSVTHEVSGDLRHFGPYLGATRVREASSALHRLYPLAYASDRLTGAEAAMAHARGVSPSDLPRLLDTLTAVLERDPVAVASAIDALAARRDDASRELAFELAGELHEEALALAWLTSEQRVTADGAPDQLVAGWHDGILVELAISDGRMRTWKQTACIRDAAARKLAASPPEWAAFAALNAQLAARLSAKSSRSPAALPKTPERPSSASPRRPSAG